MKVAYLAFSEKFPAPHAGYVHVNEITKNLSELGVEISVYAKSPNWRLLPERVERNRRIKYVKFPFLSRKDVVTDLVNLAPSYLKLIKDSGKYDLVHERLAPLNIWSRSIYDGSKPLILEINSPQVEEMENGLFKSMARVVREAKFERCDGIITQTESLREILSELTDKPIYVVSNGVDTDKFGPEKCREQTRKKYAGDKDILITFVGTFKKWHGVNQFPKIVENILSGYEDVKFLFVGDGHQHDDLKDSFSDEERVFLPGAVESDVIPGILACSDILIAPFDISEYKSLQELGFWWCPVKLFEYMASGKPVVSYDYEEVRNILRNSALLAEPRDLDGFIESLRRLIEDEDLRSDLGTTGREIAEEKHDWEIKAEETLSVYKEFI